MMLNLGRTERMAFEIEENQIEIYNLQEEIRKLQNLLDEVGDITKDIAKGERCLHCKHDNPHCQNDFLYYCDNFQWSAIEDEEVS